jgi:dTDP-4-amino-4,6-dideoxygalactose transaminase
MEVPYVDLAAAYRRQQRELDEAVLRVMAGGGYVLGEETAAFEQEFAGWLGAERVVAVDSGTAAIYLSLKALGIGSGDEVITVSHTAINTVLAVSMAGAEPVLVDIDPETFCMSPELLPGALSSRTRAVIPVHLYGHPVDMDPLLAFAAEHGLAVIEDCAQSPGARYRGRKTGTLGDCACFSFYPTKNLGACGDGGAVVTADGELAERVRSLSNCGQGEERYLNVRKGGVSRMDEVQAAVLRVRLGLLEERNSRRRRIAHAYGDALAGTGLTLPLEREWAEHVYHLYVVRSSRREELKSHLAGNGVECLVHYPVPVHRQPAYGELSGASLPQTEAAVEQILSLPVYPEMSDEQVGRVCELIKDFGG